MKLTKITALTILTAAIALAACEKEEKYKYTTPKDYVGLDTTTYINTLKTSSYAYNAGYADKAANKTAYYHSTRRSLAVIEWIPVADSTNITRICISDVNSSGVISSSNCYQ